MGQRIGWTDHSWNTWWGCTDVSPGCTNCYARLFTARFSGPGQRFENLTAKTPKGVVHWTGVLKLMAARLKDPYKWEKQAAKGKKIRVFVNAFSDTFHPAVPIEWLDTIFDVMEACPHVEFQVLTKRPERMRDYLAARREQQGVAVQAEMLARKIEFWSIPAPYSHIWCGTSVEDQTRAEERMPVLLEVPAPVRFVSAEPLIGPLDLSPWLVGPTGQTQVHWVIAGGESGPNGRRRDMNISWARDLRDQCAASNTAFFFKQSSGRFPKTHPYIDGYKYEQYPDEGLLSQWPQVYGSCEGEALDLADLPTVGAAFSV